MTEELTLIRVKRKVTDDPEKGIQFSAKKRKVDVKFSYCGTLPISSDDAKALELAKTPTRKRTNRHLTPTGDQSEKIPEKESRLYDIVHEEIENKKEVITLNGAAMIREKLNISQKENEINEYVYDIYVAPRNLDINQDDLYFEAYENPEFLQNPDRPDWEEEDDSNDEDNWRNDYPDEESDFSGDEFGRRYDYYDRGFSRGEFSEEGEFDIDEFDRNFSD